MQISAQSSHSSSPIESRLANGRRSRSSKTIVALLIAGLLLASVLGCVTDPYTGEQRISKTALGGLFGAGIGAGVAAGIAALAGKDAAKAAMIGAGAGVLTGGAVGAYMDYQDAKLREYLAGTGVQVIRNGDQITLSMPSNITFATNSDVLSSNFLDVMHSVSLVLTEYNKTVIEVMGHTDSTGSDAYNLALSQRRARSVGNHLASEGVAPMRILTEGFGEQYPVASNDTEQGRLLNRRVELRLSPLTDPNRRS
jgi:outer membrane protein OmpA-like peptidoglycan-associated protein